MSATARTRLHLHPVTTLDELLPAEPLQQQDVVLHPREDRDLPSRYAALVAPRERRRREHRAYAAGLAAAVAGLVLMGTADALLLQLAAAVAAGAGTWVAWRADATLKAAPRG